MHGNLGFQHRPRILRVGARELLQLHIFQMQHLIKALIQQQTIVGNSQNGALVGIDQFRQAHQIFKIQKYVRLVHNQQLRSAHHAADNGQQLVFTAADDCRGAVCNFAQAGTCQHLANVAVVIVGVQNVNPVQTCLIPLAHSLYILCLGHFRAECIGFCKQRNKRLCQIIISRNIRFFIFHKLADQSDFFHVLPPDFSVIKIMVRPQQHINECAFSGTVAANQDRMVSLLNGKADVMIQLFLRKTKGQICYLNHIVPSNRHVCRRFFRCHLSYHILLRIINQY